MELFLASNMLGFVLQCENFVKVVLHSYQLDISFFFMYVLFDKCNQWFLALARYFFLFLLYKCLFLIL
jgi:hypothetical protein